MRSQSVLRKETFPYPIPTSRCGALMMLSALTSSWACRQLSDARRNLYFKVHVRDAAVAHARISSDWTVDRRRLSLLRWAIYRCQLTFFCDVERVGRIHGARKNADISWHECANRRGDIKRARTLWWHVGVGRGNNWSVTSVMWYWVSSALPTAILHWD